MPDGLAHLQADQQSDLVSVLVDELGEVLQDLAPCPRVHAGPRTVIEGVARDGNRGICVGRLSPRQFDEPCSITGGGHRSSRSVNSAPGFAADEDPRRDLHLLRALSPVRRRHWVSNPGCHSAPLLGLDLDTGSKYVWVLTIAGWVDGTQPVSSPTPQQAAR